MKQFLITATMILVGTTALADQRIVQARITSVKPNYVYVNNQNPVNKCYNVDVPVYGNVGGGASGGDVLSGMIIGGLLGKGLTGQDNGAAAGAVFGGIIAADNGNKQGIVGYRTERQCETVYETEQSRQVKNYYITFEWNGMTGDAYTYNNYRVGDRIEANANLKAN